MDVIHRQWPFVAWLAVAVWSGVAWANPLNPTVVAGGAAVAGLGTSHVTVTQTTPRTIINWSQFNIGANEVTRFIQPSASAIALNRIFDQQPTQIFGTLQANGSLILLNPNGVLFGPTAQVNVGGLIVSTLNITDANFLRGYYLFDGAPLSGIVRNDGVMTAGPFGVYLLSPTVQNTGLISSPEGHVAMAAGTTAYLSDRPDGRGLLVEMRAPVGEALNVGTLVADGGQVSLFGRLVNQGGVVQANSIREQNGQIQLIATDGVTLATGSRTSATGGSDGISDAGNVQAIAGMRTGRTTVEAGAVIDVSGGSKGGNAGSVELSGQTVTTAGTILGQAAPGYRGGRLVIDPDVVDTTTLNGRFTGLSDVTVTSTSTDGDLLVTASLDLGQWVLPAGQKGTLTFSAAHDLTFQGGGIVSSDSAPTTWNLVANAVNDVNIRGSVMSIGRGGNLSIAAGRDLTLVTSQTAGTFVRTSGVDDAGAGGTLALTAGRNLVAPTALASLPIPAVSGIRSDGPGSLSITAQNFLGAVVDGKTAGPGFVLSQGRADINLTGDLGSQDNYANFILGGGKTNPDGSITTWPVTVNVRVGGNLYLSRLQDKGLTEGLDPFESNTVPMLTPNPASVVTLTSTGGDIHLSPFRDPTDNNAALKSVYPASLSVTAQQGSILIERDVNFWPSPTGSLVLSAKQNIQGVLNADGTPTLLQWYPSDPAALQGFTDFGNFAKKLSTPATDVPPIAPAPVTLTTDLGDIRTLQLRINDSGLFNKAVGIQSGRDILQVFAQIPVVSGESVTVSAARDINLSRSPGMSRLTSGLQFFNVAGPSAVDIKAGRTLDLGDSAGILVTSTRTGGFLDVNRGGQLDIAVGQDLNMVQSRILTQNGASISIHGPGGVDQPTGGSLNVGVNGTSFGQDTGILSTGGGGIDIRTTGNVEVNLSRIATFGGGDIHITSTQGNIDAGSGGLNEVVRYPVVVSISVPDPNHPGQTTTVLTEKDFDVPGSGIFTFHPADPFPLAIPQFNTPEMNELIRDITKAQFLGNTAALPLLESRLAAARSAREPVYDALFNDYVFHNPQKNGQPLQAGDIYLTAGRDIVVPPGGIRGRRIFIDAGGNLDLQGGTISGLITGTVTGAVVGNLNGIAGVSSLSTGTGLVSTIGVGGALTGTVGTVVASAVNAATTTSVRASNQMALEESRATAEREQAKAVAEAVSGNGGSRGGPPGRGGRGGLRRGVGIDVFVQPE